MMRNCFKRYDKSNQNSDFNSIGVPAKQSNSLGGSSHSPLITSKTLKSQKSTTINPVSHNVSQSLFPRRGSV